MRKQKFGKRNCSKVLLRRATIANCLLWLYGFNPNCIIESHVELSPLVIVYFFTLGENRKKLLFSTYDQI